MAESKFTFGAVLEREIDRELESAKKTIQDQLKKVTASATQNVDTMNKTAADYQSKAAAKLAEFDSLITKRFEAFKSEMKGLVEDLSVKVDGLHTRQAVTDKKFDAIAKAASKE